MATKSKAAATKDAASDAKPKTTRKPAAKRAAPKTAAKKPAAQKAPAKKAPAKKTPAKTPAKSAPAVANAAPKASPIKGVTKADASSAPKAAPKTTPVAAGDQNPAEKPADMTKKELIERVVAATGKKPREVRPVIEATLTELGAAVDRGEILRLNPFGTMKIQRAKPTPGGRVVVTKIKRKNATETPKDPLAKAAE